MEKNILSRDPQGQGTNNTRSYRFITVIDNLLLASVLSMLQSREYSSKQFPLGTDKQFFSYF